MSDNGFPDLSGIQRLAREVLRLYSVDAQRVLRLNEQLQRLSQQVWGSEDLARFRVLASITMARGGWHDVPLHRLPARAFRYVVRDVADLPDAEVREELDHGMPQVFRHDDHRLLREMVNSWDLLSEWRTQVARDALWAHADGKYTLSVPALLPLIEGTLRSETGVYSEGNYWIRCVNRALYYRYDTRYPPGWPTRADVEDAVAKAEMTDTHERRELADKISLEHALHRINELYNRVEFDSLEPTDPTNRNAVLHGVAEHLSEIDSLKAFCAIELMHEVLRAYRDAADRGRER